MNTPKAAPKQQDASFMQTIESWNLKELTKVFFVLGAIIALVTGYFWYSRLYLNEERRFWNAIESSMSTPTVTRTLVSGGTGNLVTQKQQFIHSPQMATLSSVEFEQKSATDSTRVVTEGIAFSDALYSRYTEFSTNQPGADGSDVNLDEILGKWEGTVVTDEALLDEARLNYVSELVTLVIFGNFDADHKRSVLQELKDNDVYRLQADSGTDRDTVDDDVNVKLYQVSIGLREFARQLSRSYVHSGHGEFPPLDPANYEADARIPATITVSKRTGAVVGVSFGTRQEVYSGHGIMKTVERPETEYEAGELENIVGQELDGVL